MPALRPVSRLILVLGLAALPAIFAPAVARAATTFTNAAPVAIPSIGAATPYPSTINVSGLAGLVGDVDVTINNWNYGSFGYDVDVLLVGPGGQKMIPMADVGNSQNNTTLTFSDGAPSAPLAGFQMVSGVYAPTNNVDSCGGAPDEFFPGPAPAGPYGSTLSVFNGTNPNGTWSLYVVDDCGGGSGSFSDGWSLTISLPSPDINVSNATITEGDVGTVNATFTVSLTGPSNQPVSVSYATVPDTATSADYVPKSGTVTFNPGVVSRSITVAVKGDLADEPDETYLLHLSNPSNAGIGNGTGTGTIVDNDPVPAIFVNDVTVTEGNSGTTGATFTVSLSNPSSQAIAVDYDTDDGTAKAGSDYKAKSGTKVFLAGQTTKTITVSVIGETAQESTETFFLNLADPDNAVLVDGQGLGTIVDNDTPELSIDDVSATEVNSGATKTYTFHVTLNHAGTSTITVAYATANGTAVAPGDYAAKSGSLSFSPGVTSKNVTVTVKGDNAVEPDEVFFVNLSSPTNAVIADGQGQGTIVNND